ncbi:MAG TPA: sigma-70 family RNA polymerase sigma factor [Roseiflexaceae bacterium]|nr:sigma-70 family RNA polymerase sigma factor [Roseiflexaceae bacterium]
MPASSQLDVITRAKQGDHEALTALYEEYSPLLYRFILYRVGDAQLAEDLHADIFVRMLEDLPRYEDRGWKISAWLYQIARDRIIDTWRKQRRHPAVPLSDWHGFDESMERETEARVLCDEVTRSLGQLTPEQRDVIRMRFYLDMPITAVAEHLDRSPAAVKSLQYRGVRALSEMFESPFEERSIVQPVWRQCDSYQA